MTIHTYVQPGSLTQKYEAFRPLYFTWQDSSADAMVGSAQYNSRPSANFRPKWHNGLSKQVLTGHFCRPAIFIIIYLNHVLFKQQ